MNNFQVLQGKIANKVAGHKEFTNLKFMIVNNDTILQKTGILIIEIKDKDLKALYIHRKMKEF